jgi:23S rRNA (pseudouridine1915-N3)-methyltransferase
MRAVLLTVGRTRVPHAEAEAHYRKLLSRYLDLEVIEARDDPDLTRRIPLGAHVTAIDRGGQALDSEGWSLWLDERRLAARDVCLLIGGPRGLPTDALATAAERISFGPPTLPHQLARVVLLEQLYRAAKILAGEPYHY